MRGTYVVGRLLRSHTRANGEAGFSLLEVVVALAIFSVFSLALLTMILSSARLAASGRARTAAGHVAQSVLDEARAAGAVAVAPGRTTETRSVDGRDFTIVREARFISRGAGGGSCSSPGVPSFLRVRVSVTTPAMGRAAPAEANTLIAPRVGDVDTATGNVAVTVVDRDGAPAVAVPVTLAAGTTAGSGPTQFTTSEGCAFFAFVSPATYTAVLDQAGWVGPTGTRTVTVTTSVRASVTANVQMQYDKAGRLTLQPVVQLGYPAPRDLAWTLYNTAFVNGTKTIEPTGALPVVVPEVFPARDGYSGWPGRCAANDPGQLRPSAVVVERGGSATLAASLKPVSVEAQDNAGRKLTSAWRLVAEQAADAGCSSGQTYQFNVSASAGGTADISLPSGDWVFTVIAGARTARSSVTTLDAHNTRNVVSVRVRLP